jgi:hypothetical protein
MGAQGYLKRLRIALILADWLEALNLKARGYEHPTLSGKFNENRHFRQHSATFVRIWLRRFIGYLLVESQSAHGGTWRYEPDSRPDDAVQCEPVSAPNSLLTGKNTVKFALAGRPKRGFAVE